MHLQTFRVRERSYHDQANPPVLHRKEEFVGSTHPLKDKFARLTRLEEAKGLFKDPASIGTRDGWARALGERGLAISIGVHGAGSGRAARGGPFGRRAGAP